MSEPSVVKLERKDEAVLVVIQMRRPDHKAVEQMKHRITTAAGHHRGRPFVVDMSQLDFVRSELMGALVELNREMRKEGHRFLLAGMGRQVRAAFAVARSDLLLEICPDVDSALASL